MIGGAQLASKLVDRRLRPPEAGGARCARGPPAVARARARRSAPGRATSACRPARAAPPAPRRSGRSRGARGRAPRAAPSSGISSAPASTIVSASFVPTTIRSTSLSSSSRQRRVDDELAVDAADPDRADRAEKRQRRDHQRGGRAVDAEDVVRDDQVGGEHGADHLHLVAEALRPERPDRAVDHARGQDRALGRSPLALEETAGDLPGGVHPLLDVDGEREEVRAFARLHAGPAPSPAPSCRPGGRRRRRRPASRACPSRRCSSSRPTGTVTVCGPSVAIAISPPLPRERGGLSQLPLAGRSSLRLPLPPVPLPSEAQLLDQGAVALEVVPLKVVEQPPPAADELQQPAPRVVVVLVRAQVLRQLVDPAGQAARSEPAPSPCRLRRGRAGRRSPASLPWSATSARG